MQERFQQDSDQTNKERQTQLGVELKPEQTSLEVGKQALRGEVHILTPKPDVTTQLDATGSVIGEPDEVSISW